MSFLSTVMVVSRRINFSRARQSLAKTTHWIASPAVLFAVALVALSPGQVSAQSDTQLILSPAQTTSPRATLFSFLEKMEQAYTAGEKGEARRSAALLDQAILYLDLSELPARPAYYLRAEAALKLKEVLDRLELPAREATPDRLQALGQLRETGIILGGGGTEDPIRLWELPGTSLRIHLIEDGPRTGEYLFTPRTIEQIDLWYEKLRRFPYRTNSTPGIFDAYALTPGLGIAPARSERMPEFLQISIGEQTLWQWLALTGTFLSVALTIWVLFRLAERIDHMGSSERRELRVGKLVALGVSVWLLSAADFLIDRVFNITGDVLLIAGGTLTIAWHAFMAWFGYSLVMFAVDLILRLRQMEFNSAPAQLTRLTGMAVGALLVLLQIVLLAEAFGLPAVSVIAGFGVGGLAVSLAARETLSDLLGSLVVLIEQPYKVGDFIGIGDEEGTVEYIGFRSTRIRPVSGLVVSIPNSALAGNKIVNYGLRRYRMSESNLRFSDRTSPGDMDSFLMQVRGLLKDHPHVQADTFLVNFRKVGSGFFEVLIRYYLDVKDNEVFLAECEKLLFDTLNTASAMGIELAPTQTVVATTTGEARP